MKLCFKNCSRVLYLTLALVISVFFLYVLVETKVAEPKVLRDSMFQKDFVVRQEELLKKDRILPQAELVLLGDSHIEFIPNAFFDDRTLNLGVRGDTTLGLLDRMSSYKSLGNVRIVVLSIGTNNIAQDFSAHKTIDDIQNIISALSGKPDVYLTILHPLDESKGFPGFNKKVRAFNAKFRSINIPDRKVIIIESPFMSEGDTYNLNPEYHIGDGIHLNELGYRTWINNWPPELQYFVTKVP